MLQASERCVREYRFEVDVPGADGHEGAICRWMRGVVISSRTCRTSSRGLLTGSRRSSSNCRWPLDSFVRPDTCRWKKGSHEVSEDHGERRGVMSLAPKVRRCSHSFGWTRPLAAGCRSVFKAGRPTWQPFTSGAKRRVTWQWVTSWPPR